MKKVVAFTGYKGSGKNTAAEYMVNHYEGEMMGFADPIREIAKTVFGLTEKEMTDRILKELPLERYPFNSPREILRDIGMWFRSNWEGVWIKNMESRCEKIWKSGGTAFIYDLRFLDETEWVQSVNGVIVRIKKDGLESDGHPSEKDIDKLPANRVVYNNGSFADLYYQLEEIAYVH